MQNEPVNPYAPPRESAAPALRETNSNPWPIVWAVLGVATALVVVRWVFEHMRAPVSEWFAPILMGWAIGAVAARGVRRSPEGAWAPFAAMVTGAALAVGAFLPSPEPRRFNFVLMLFGLLNAWIEVARAKRKLAEADAVQLRDDDPRTRFAREPAPPPPPRSRALTRFACEECGELTLESELTFVGDERRCSRCA